MIQIIAAIVVAVWFFRSARAIGKSGVLWAFLGVLALLAPSIPWAIFARLVILPMLFQADLGDAGAVISGLLIGLIGVGLGLVIVFLMHSNNLQCFRREPPKDSPVVQDDGKVSCPSCGQTFYGKLEPGGKCPLCGAGV